jgi:hypothetical protein
VSLQPRYRRLYTFGDVLDESVRLYRAHWVPLALVSAVSLLPPGLIVVGVSAAGLLSTSFNFAALQAGSFDNPDFLSTQINALLAIAVISVVFSIVWTAAIVSTTDAYLRGEEAALSRVYGRAIRRFFIVLLASLAIFLAQVVLTLIGGVLFVITVFGVLGSLIASVALVVWWMSPSARKTWVKWLIILTSPFGLPTYYLVRWSMYIVAIVLEGHGPLSSLRRSSQLVAGHWFRVMGVLSVASLIVGILLSVLSALINFPLAIFEATRGQFGLSPGEAAISSGFATVVRILFESIGVIVYTILFVDLRNRREGTDIAERLSQLEATPITANG